MFWYSLRLDLESMLVEVGDGSAPLCDSYVGFVNLKPSLYCSSMYCQLMKQC